MKAFFVCLMLAAAIPGQAQFQLYLVNGNIEQPVVRTYDLGAAEPGSSLSAPLRIRNVSAAAATLDLLKVSGAGFLLSSVNQPVLPLSLGPQKSVDFTVVFQAAGTGLYSASLDSVGISVILTANVPVELTAQLETAAGVRPLGAATADFGTVPRGTSALLHILLVNQTNAVLVAPGPLVTGAGFALHGPSPGGNTVQPAAGVAFDLQFAPTTDGVAAGFLSLGDRSYALTGTGVEPALPQPRLSLSLPQPGSAQQGAVAVNLDIAATVSGTGLVTLTFVPAVPISAGAIDAGIAFASGGQTSSFTVSAGDRQGHFGTQLSALFQTGTTAGTLRITVQLGNNSDQQSITILPAVVGVTAAQAMRSAGAVEVDLTGFDNTRSASALAFSFFDSNGNILGAPINADGAASFAPYFLNAAGGTFVLKAVFPVLGDTSQIKAFQAVVTNSAGSASTARTSF